MTIKDIIADYLRRKGYDGLCNAGLECGCTLDDFMPCSGDYGLGCEPGMRRAPRADLDEDTSAEFVVVPGEPRTPAVSPAAKEA